jgi:hypothetical protein
MNAAGFSVNGSITKVISGSDERVLGTYRKEIRQCNYIGNAEPYHGLYQLADPHGMADVDQVRLFSPEAILRNKSQILVFESVI